MFAFYYECSSNSRYTKSRQEHVMRPLRYFINVTLDGCCDHRAMFADEDLHRHAVENLAQADALPFGRVTYEMMEPAWRVLEPLCAVRSECSRPSIALTNGLPANCEHHLRSASASTPVRRSSAAWDPRRRPLPPQ